MQFENFSQTQGYLKGFLECLFGLYESKTWNSDYEILQLIE